ncbi:MAG: hypothetical protein L6R39_005645, partial [Caloplaca ligustica]
MLLRAAVRSFRPGTPSLPIRASIPYFQSRAYAKPPRPKKPYEYQPPARQPSSPQKPPVAPNAPSESTVSSLKKGIGQSSKGQDNFETRPQSASTNEPVSSRNSPGTTAGNTSYTSSPTDYSTLQDQNPTSAPSDQSTAPHTTSTPLNHSADAQAEQQEPQRPLPDLTQGIPSTLDAELNQAEQASRAQTGGLKTTDDPSQTSTGGRRGGGGGDLPRSANITSMERRWNRLVNYMYAALFSSALLGTIYLGRNWESEEEERKHPNAPSGWGFGLFYNRASARLANTLDYYNEPAFEKLLPDPDPAWERPYTLVLSLEDLLVHSEWTREHGWRMAKRPGVDYFLRYLSQYYELVIFTSLPSMTGDPIIRKLDPYRV